MYLSLLKKSTGSLRLPSGFNKIQLMKENSKYVCVCVGNDFNKNISRI